VATMTIDLTSSKPALTSVPDTSKSAKGKTEAFKPVTGEKTEKKVSKER